MTLYSIQDTTLIGIADALRGWHGDTKTITMSGVVEVPKTIVSKTPNATSFSSYTGGYGNNQRLYDVVTIEGASSIKVKMAYQSEGLNWDWVQVASGNLTSMPGDAVKYGGKDLLTTELAFENTDTITFYFQTDNSGDTYLGYYAECYGLDENDDYIMVEEWQTWEEEEPNIYKPEEMAAGISSISYFSDEELTFSGDLSYMFANDKWKKVLEQEQSRVQIKDATNLQYLFSGSSYEDLSWLTIGSDGTTTVKIGNILDNCHNLKKLPNFKDVLIYTNQSSNFFSNCYSLNDTEGFINFFKNVQFDAGTPQIASYFYCCYSLRNIDAVMPHWATAWEAKNSANYVHYWGMFQDCMALDEVNGVYVNPHAESTSNRLSGIVNGCMRLKNFTFKTNEDGSPIVVSWKSQTLDFTGSNIGSYNLNYGQLNRLYSYNSGITADKEVKDDATYQALKNDPDWFTQKLEYSRYNHDSAVNTINSLPDTSAYGTNTVKFKGAAGSATDGGAINTLTEEEIAVATAKGWTVTLT